MQCTDWLTIFVLPETKYVHVSLILPPRTKRTVNSLVELEGGLDATLKKNVTHIEVARQNGRETHGRDCTIWSRHARDGTA